MAKKKENKTEKKPDIEQPKVKCEDNNCPFHGGLKVRGKRFICTVISAKRHKTATVLWERRQFVKKYDRFEKRRTKIHVHNPDCIGAKKGEKVLIAECKPLSKTKGFVILERLGEDILYQQREEGLEEGKYQKKEEPADGEVKEKPKEKPKDEVVEE